MDLKQRLAQFGPGLLYAGAAIGVSHLVQSTRAGAEFGLQLIGVVVLVNVLKYPIFQMGPRYAAATGKTLLDGYMRISPAAVWVYILMSVLTMCIIMGAISIVTAGLFSQLVGLQMPAEWVAVLLLLVSSLLLGWGHYTALDKAMKFIVILLTVSTVLALLFTIGNPIPKETSLMPTFELTNKQHMLFLVALIGWMPAPIDISIWHSVWSVSKNKEQGKRIPLRQALLDFNIGYWGTTFLAVCFVALGAAVMYGTSQPLASGSVQFAGQLIQLYTKGMGQWAFPFIALAAFTTMFSTLLTCLDAFPRTLRTSVKLLFPPLTEKRRHQPLYWSWLLFTSLGTSIVLLFFGSDMRTLVDVATTVSFVVAPVFAILNFVAFKDTDIHDSAKLSPFMKRFAIVSIVLLTLFSIWYLLQYFELFF